MSQEILASNLDWLKAAEQARPLVEGVLAITEAVCIDRYQEAKMTEEEARLALLQTELTGIQGAIRDLDRILFQIKGLVCNHVFGN